MGSVGLVIAVAVFLNVSIRGTSYFELVYFAQQRQIIAADFDERGEPRKFQNDIMAE